MVAHTFDPFNQHLEAEADRALWIWCQPGLHSEFKPARATERPYLKEERMRQVTCLVSFLGDYKIFRRWNLLEKASHWWPVLRGYSLAPLQVVLLLPVCGWDVISQPPALPPYQPAAMPPPIKHSPSGVTGQNKLFLLIFSKLLLVMVFPHSSRRVTNTCTSHSTLAETTKAIESWVLKMRIHLCAWQHDSQQTKVGATQDLIYRFRNEQTSNVVWVEGEKDDR